MRAFLFFLAIACLAACREQPKTAAVDTGPINEQTFIELGGGKQYVEMTGDSSTNPVLLFIHGGPGWPQTPHLRYFNADLAKEVILVSWEQSGSGKSYMNNPDPGNLSLEQIVQDAHELTQVLKKKFNQEKIFVAGFSWGSVVGLKLAEKYPEDYLAYFSISQVIDINESIRQSRKWIAQQATSNNDTATLKTLSRIAARDTGICKTDLECFFAQYELLSKYRGAIYKKESDDEIQKAVTKYADYADYDWMAGFMYSIKKLESDVFKAHFINTTEIKVPVYFLVGRHDWNLPAQVTVDFANQLKAPVKEIIWFENSGHEPLEEEAGKFNEVIMERVKKR